MTNLCLTLTCACLHFTTPSPGAFCLLSSTNLLSWKVVYSGYFTNVVHVTVPHSSTPMAFYRCKFQPDNP